MLRNDVAEYWEKKGKIQIMKNNKSMADRVVVEVKEVKDYKNLTKKELIEELEAKGINYKKKDNKQILLELLK
jgi:predicted transcriptional regulator YheO